MDKIKKMTLQIFHTVSRKLSWSQISEHFTIINVFRGQGGGKYNILRKKKSLYGIDSPKNVVYLQLILSILILL